MRLLHSTTLELKEFADNNIPRYAILSHTWEEEEVIFQDMKGTGASGKAGYSKIKGCGEKVAADGLEYFWVDTCCIDKSSSVELSEAINSMYRWYKNAEVCYVYLSDISAGAPPHPRYPTVSTFESSRWLTRGWTLQELIAPSNIIFYAKEWQQIGTKTTLKKYLENITKVDVRALEGADPCSFSVARRMSWAAGRETTRIEDVAYSLMGIFDINMPLLYGEGEKAFIRLQEEIMKTSNDQSLFVWKDSNKPNTSYSGLLARSPAGFATSGHISPLGALNMSEPFSLTSWGLRVRLFLVPYNMPERIYRACPDCQIGKSLLTPAIYLQRLSHRENQHYTRIKTDMLDALGPGEKAHGRYNMVYVSQQNIQPSKQPQELDSLKYFWIRLPNRYRLLQVFPPMQWDPQAEIFRSPGSLGKVGALLIKADIKRFVVILGISRANTAWCRLMHVASRTLEQIYESYEYDCSENSNSTLHFLTFDDIVANVGVGYAYGLPVFIITVEQNNSCLYAEYCTYFLFAILIAVIFAVKLGG